MFDYRLLFDVAKVCQDELACEVEMTCISRDLHRNLRRNGKSTSLTEKLRIFLTAIF